MVCETCNALLAKYRRLVTIFTQEVVKAREAFGPDAKLAGKKVDKLQLVCQGAREALLEHWRREHSSLAEAAKRLR